MKRIETLTSMRAIREWIHRFWATVRPDRRDDDLAEELRLHLEMVAEAAQRRGHDPNEAVRIARIEAGGTSLAMDAVRDQRGLPWLEDVARDVSYGLRVLRRTPIFTAIAIMSLALGIGANAAIFQLIDALALRSLAIANPNELAEVRADGVDGFGINEGANGRVTYPLWEQIRTHQRAFSSMFAWGNAAFIVGRGADARPADGSWVSGDFFRVLGITPARGRLIDTTDDQRGCGTGSAVISHDFWQTSLGASELAVGSTLTILEQPFVIVGVTRPGFTGLEIGRRFDIALPLCSAALWSQNLDRRDYWWLRVMGRLEPGWTLDGASQLLRTLSPGVLDATVPAGYSAELTELYRAFRFGVFPAGRGVSRLREAYSTPLSVLFGLTGLVLLITCGNLATLMLARASAREREIAVRVAIGASRRRLVSQMVTESLLLAAAGGVAAVPVALLCGKALVTFLDTTANPVTLTLGANWRLISFVGAISVLTTLVFGSSRRYVCQWSTRS